ncbi:MAG: hypothetical protein QM773_19185 [Hyphomonadaceae bacterium]
MMRSLILLPLLSLALASCAPKPAHAAVVNDFSTCPAAKPAMEVMDHFLAAFNAKDMTSLEKTFHFPHMRIASYPLQVWTGPGQQDDVFGNLASEGWARSRWDERTIVQCGKEKAHIIASFARLHADGAEYGKYDGLYVIELRDGFWGITVRSTFAP